MEQLHFITKLLKIKDFNIQIMNIINLDTQKEIIAKRQKKLTFQYIYFYFNSDRFMCCSFK